MPDLPCRLEVAEPWTGRRCPAWLDGEHVVAACGVVSPEAPVYAVGPQAEAVARRLREMGYRLATAEGEG